MTGLLTSSTAVAQQVLSADPDSTHQTIVLTDGAAAQQSSTQSDNGFVELTWLRMQGVDVILVAESYSDIPDFRVQFDAHPTAWEQSPLVSFTPISDGLTLGSDIRFNVGRSTALRDGGIAGSHGTIITDSPEDELPSLAQSEGEYDLYDLALSWEAISSGPLKVSLTSGLKAIDGHINKRVTTGSTTELQDAQRVALLPVIGTGVEWKFNEQFSISGSAKTHPITGAGSIIDVNAMTAYHITNSMDLSVGYSLIRSSFDIGAVGAEVTQEGLFARLQIRF